MPAPASRSAVVICACLLVLFAGMAWFAAESKSPAYDEPYHAISAYLQLRYADFRVDNEDPPLWQYWASLANPRSALSIDFDDPIWKAMPMQLVHQWYWGVQVLYRTPGNDPVRLITRCRAMMLCVAVLLGVLICYWAWRIAGPVAAVVATTLFCFDPNFLAHSPLMKNDVAFAMSMFGLAMALWKAGKKLDVEAVAWVLLMCVVTLTVKFSGFVAAMSVPLLLGTRAILPRAWPVALPGLSRMISTRLGRLMIAGGVTFLAMLISWVGIWAVYGFRYDPTPQKGITLNMNELATKVQRNAFLARYAGYPPPDAKATDQLPPIAHGVLFANDHHLLPQPFLAGFLFTYSNALIRSEYLCGQLSVVGWWWYFPFAILVKSAVGTLLACAIAAVIAMRALLRGKFNAPERCWTALCLLLPFLLFLASAMSSSLNIGIRHVLAIYPFAFVAVGCIAASVWQADQRKSRTVILSVGLLLAVESLWAFPNYIPFFNFLAARTAEQKIALLGDSNIDWGQDLPLLLQWQQAHPDEKLYLSYFGYADPAYYGLKYTSLPGGYSYDTHRQWVDPYSPSIVAISATNLQGILKDAELEKYYQQWKKQTPIAVLGDSIFLYRYDPASMH